MEHSTPYSEGWSRPLSFRATPMLHRSQAIPAAAASLTSTRAVVIEPVPPPTPPSVAGAATSTGATSTAQ